MSDGCVDALSNAWRKFNPSIYFWINLLLYAVHWVVFDIVWIFTFTRENTAF
jgi:hypothetical protein